MKLVQVMLIAGILSLMGAVPASAQSEATSTPVEARIPVAALNRTTAQALALAKAIYAILISEGHAISAVTLTDSNDQTLASFSAAQLAAP